MIEHAEYAKVAITCEAKPGICFKDAYCESCETARKYKFDKEVHRLVRQCPYKSFRDECSRKLSSCVGAECARMLREAEWNLKNDKT